MTGIYKIVNKFNLKYYVGSSINIDKRWINHKRQLNKNKHHNKHLQCAWDKYGKDSFEFVFIEEIPKENLLVVEQKYLDVCRMTPDTSYNTCYDASAPMKGRIHTFETRRKMSLSNTGYHHSNNTKEKLKHISLNYNGMKGKHQSESAKEKIRNFRLGKPLSEEHKQKIRNGIWKKKMETTNQSCPH